MKGNKLTFDHYGARDIERLLGINKCKLFYWIKNKRLLRPEKREVSGTGRGNVFSFRNLLDLQLINILINYGFELNAIRKIIKPGYYMIADPKLLPGVKIARYTYQRVNVKNIWFFIKKKRKLFEKHGCVLLVIREKESKVIVANKDKIEAITKTGYIDREIATKERIANIYMDMKKPWDTNPEFEHFLYIDLLNIITKLEKRTEDKL